MKLVFYTCLVLSTCLVSALGCKPSPPQEVPQAINHEDGDDGPVQVTLARSAEDADESPDEIEEDIAQDTEDFDLICDGHVFPNRTQRLPDVIIIGVKKGGTRALIEFLKLHPSLKASGPEIHYFDKHYDNDLDWYIAHLPPVTDEQLPMEKTPGYFHHKEAAGRIYKMKKDIKLLLILRDPVKRLISDYNQFRSRNLDQGNTYPDLEELVLNDDGSVKESYPPVQRSIYHQHIARWYKYFPKEQLHIVNGEKFIREPWAELQKVETFLDVDPVIKQDNFFFNGTKGFFCAKDIRHTGVWECTKRKCLSKTKGRPKPPVQPETIDKLRKFFKPHNVVFQGLVGKEFDWPAD